MVPLTGGSVERGSSSVVVLTATTGDEEKQTTTIREDSPAAFLRPSPSQSQLSLTASVNPSDAGSTRTMNPALKKKLSASGLVMTV